MSNISQAERRVAIASEFPANNAWALVDEIMRLRDQNRDYYHAVALLHNVLMRAGRFVPQTDQVLREEMELALTEHARVMGRT